MSQSQIPSAPDSKDDSMTPEERELFDEIVQEGAQGLHEIMGLRKSVKTLKHQVMDDTDVPEISTPPEITNDAA